PPDPAGADGCPTSTFRPQRARRLGKMSTMTSDAADADRALKAKHRAMWASGDYAAVAAEVVPQLGPVLVDAAAVRPGEKVLDVGAGTGNAAIPAALAGARVTASDLSPELLDIGRKVAAG